MKHCFYLPSFQPCWESTMELEASLLVVDTSQNSTRKGNQMRPKLLLVLFQMLLYSLSLRHLETLYIYIAS